MILTYYMHVSIVQKSILPQNFVFMEIFNYHVLVMVVVLFLLINAASSNIHNDQSSLLALKSHITLDPYNILRNNWTIGTSVCSWIGVTCGSHHNRVTAMDISDMGLVGTIPPEIGNLSFLVSLNMSENLFHGPIPISIFNMSRLQVISLQYNRLSGSLPNDMCSSHHNLHRRLREFDASFNQLYGEIPSSLDQYSQLESINLSGNSFVGNLPSGIGNLSSLTDLYMYENLLHGPIPTSFFNMSSLRGVSLGNNRLSGELPVDVCGHNNLPKLKYLDLRGNKFGGEIPSSLGQCPQLKYIQLSRNNFAGHLPTDLFSQLSQLQLLDLSSNRLTGPLPTQIGNLTSLQLLYLYNNSLDGHLLSDLFSQLSQLQGLDLSSNRLIGPLPTQIGNLTSLRRLSLFNNSLDGPIPYTIGNLSQLEYLVLYSNKLRGEIPPSLCNLRSLVFLHLSRNSLEGPIPHCLGNLSTSLVVLHLKENHFHGLISATFTFTQYCPLQSLVLNGNKFEGALPTSLVHCRQLEILDVGNNEIQDAFPFWIETLPLLQVLVLRSNRFNGTILQDSKAKVPFPSLQVFDISHNEFTGPLPTRYFENFKSMIDVKESKEDNMYSSYEEFLFVLKGVELPLVRFLKTFTTIDMSNNSFSGAIPQFIGNINSLRYFNLSHNNITGNIPTSLRNMSVLESLDLSSNQLTGEIPLELTQLTFLSKLNLSFNNLVGQIPQSTQFSTFENNSYTGNSGLCGSPLTKKCKQDNVQSDLPILLPQGNDDSGFINGFSWHSVALGYGCGFLFGATIGYFIFRYERPKWFVDLFFNELETRGGKGMEDGEELD